MNDFQRRMDGFRSRKNEKKNSYKISIYGEKERQAENDAKDRKKKIGFNLKRSSKLLEILIAKFCVSYAKCECINTVEILYKDQRKMKIQTIFLLS